MNNVVNIVDGVNAKSSEGVNLDEVFCGLRFGYDAKLSDLNPRDFDRAWFEYAERDPNIDGILAMYPTIGLAGVKRMAGNHIQREYIKAASTYKNPESVLTHEVCAQCPLHVRCAEKVSGLLTNNL